MDTILKHKEYGLAICTKPPLKTYGRITRNGKRYYRNYKRELKNGKGLSQLDIMFLCIERTKDVISKNLLNNSFRGLKQI